MYTEGCCSSRGLILPFDQKKLWLQRIWTRECGGVWGEEAWSFKRQDDSPTAEKANLEQGKIRHENTLALGGGAKCGYQQVWFWNRDALFSGLIFLCSACGRIAWDREATNGKWHSPKNANVIETGGQVAGLAELSDMLRRHSPFW